MKSPIPIFRELLLANTGVRTILVSDKVWANEIPQGTTRPVIRLIEISGQPLGEPLDIEEFIEPWERRVSVECQGDTNTMADNLAEAALKALDGFFGVSGQFNVQALRIISDVVIFEDTLRIVQRVLDFRISYGYAT